MNEFEDGTDDDLLNLEYDYNSPQQPTQCIIDNPENSDRINESSDENESSTTPLERFRPGYLWVSDLTKQTWCEQQMVYNFTVPGIVVEDPVLTKGTDLHLARELAVHDKVQVNVTSSEDIWAIKVINLLAAAQGFLAGAPVAREVPIFGVGFDSDTFFVGIIDELRFDLESYAIDLSELKTRKSRTKPPKVQEKQHKLQVWLYKKLFDDLVKGRVSNTCVAKYLKLELRKELGEEVRQHVEQSGVTCTTLDSLMSFVLERMQALTCIGNTTIEYVHQESSETFLHQQVEYDENEFRSIYTHCLSYWRGQRSPEGVDIEEAWKCQRCDFEAKCDWRKKKAEECASKNIVKNKIK